MGNEALYLQRMMKSHKRPANVFAIAGGEGGVGKTNTAANLAGRFLNTRLYDAGLLVKDERLNAAARLPNPLVLAYPKLHITSSLVTLAAKLTNGPAAWIDVEGPFLESC